MEKYATLKEAATGVRHTFRPFRPSTSQPSTCRTCGTCSRLPDHAWPHAFTDKDSRDQVLTIDNRFDPLFVQAVEEVDVPTMKHRDLKIKVRTIAADEHFKLVEDGGSEKVVSFRSVNMDALRAYAASMPDFTERVLAIMSANGIHSLENLDSALGFLLEEGNTWQCY
jgi:hypothetical protein